MDTASLLWGVVYGSIGFDYLMYGRKQKSVVPSVCGLALIVMPYFVAGNWLLLALGSACMALPIFLKI